MAIETDDCNIAEFLVPGPIVQSVITARRRQLVELAEPTSNKQHLLPLPRTRLLQPESTGPADSLQSWSLPTWLSGKDQP